MKTLLTIFLCLFAANVWAAPFVVSDPYAATATQPDGFVVSMDGGAVVESPADPVTASTKRFKFDVGGVSAGNHTINVKAFVYDATWGRVESAEAVFTFARPAAPAVPAGLRLAP